MSEVTIRSYRRRDRDAVLDITDASFDGFCMDSNMERHFGLIAGTRWQERKRAAILYDLRRNPRHAFVAEVDEIVVGYVCNRVYPDVSTGHIANMAVSAAHQDKGIGRALIQASLDHFRKEGLHYARIETLEQNERAKHLYPSFDFQEIGRQVYYFRAL